MIRFVVEDVVPKGRPRTVVVHDKRGRVVCNQKTGRPKMRIYTPVRTKEFEYRVAWSALAARGGPGKIEGPVGLRIVLKGRTAEIEVFPFPDGDPDGKVGDLSNILKAIEDACNGVLYGDDAQVAYLEVTRT